MVGALEPASHADLSMTGVALARTLNLASPAPAPTEHAPPPPPLRLSSRAPPAGERNDSVSGRRKASGEEAAGFGETERRKAFAVEAMGCGSGRAASEGEVAGFGEGKGH